VTYKKILDNERDLVPNDELSPSWTSSSEVTPLPWETVPP